MSEQLIDVKEVGRRTSLSRTMIWSLVKDGKFPRATRIGRAIRWRAAVIDAWVLERTRASEQADAARAGEERTGA